MPVSIHIQNPLDGLNLFQRLKWLRRELRMCNRGSSMKTISSTIRVAGLMAVAIGTTIAQEPRPTPLEGKGASIEYRGEGEPDTFKPGAILFTNRTYTIAECPEWLKEKRFLRGSIDSGNFRVTAAGVLTLLTPEPVHPRAATQAKTLEARGFVWIAQPERFQLFGQQPFDLVRIYQKQVQPGERFRLGKWAVAVGFEAATPWAPADTPWSENRGERLYNGIVLPQEWPPQDIDPRETEPMPVPYLNRVRPWCRSMSGGNSSWTISLWRRRPETRLPHAGQVRRQPGAEAGNRTGNQRARNAAACPRAAAFGGTRRTDLQDLVRGRLDPHHLLRDQPGRPDVGSPGAGRQPGHEPGAAAGPDARLVDRRAGLGRKTRSRNTKCSSAVRAARCRARA